MRHFLIETGVILDMNEPAEQEALPSKFSKVSRPRRSQWLGAVLVLICIAVSWGDAIDVSSEAYIDSALTQALFAYGGARALNAGISLMQSAEFQQFPANPQIR